MGNACVLCPTTGHKEEVAKGSVKAPMTVMKDDRKDTSKETTQTGVTSQNTMFGFFNKSKKFEVCQKWDIMEITSEENSCESAPDATMNQQKDDDVKSLVSSVGIRRSNSSDQLSCRHKMEDLIESPSPVPKFIPQTKMKRDTERVLAKLANESEEDSCEDECSDEEIERKPSSKKPHKPVHLTIEQKARLKKIEIAKVAR